MRRHAVIGLALVVGMLALACSGGDAEPRAAANAGTGTSDVDVSGGDVAVSQVAVAQVGVSQEGERTLGAHASGAGSAERPASAGSTTGAAPSPASADAASDAGGAPAGTAAEGSRLAAAADDNVVGEPAAGETTAGGATSAAAETRDAPEVEVLVVAAVEPRRPLIVLDPGHGGAASGAAAFGVVERDSNLDFALRVEPLLQAAGFDVILTRRTQARTAGVPETNAIDVPGFLLNRRDLQARVDLANAAGADLYVAIHSNGAADPSASGVEVYWDGLRPHAAENERLAQALQESVLESLQVATGYGAWDRGIREDTCWHISERDGECSPIFVLGPAQEIERSQVVLFGLDPAVLGFRADQDVLATRATQMPAALLELLFITNPWEAGVLKDEASRQAMAVGIMRGIVRYFAEGALVSERGGADAEAAELDVSGLDAGPAQAVTAGAG